MIGFYFSPQLKDTESSFLDYLAAVQIFFPYLMVSKIIKVKVVGICISWLMQPHLRERFGIFYRDEYNINCSNYTFLEQLPNLYILIKVTLLWSSKERWIADARKIVFRMQLYWEIKWKLPLKMKILLQIL